MSTKKVKPELHSEAQAEVASFAQKTVDQAQAAFEKVSEVAHSNVQLMDDAANAYKNRVTDIQLKTMEFAQLNLNAGFAFARKLEGEGLVAWLNIQTASYAHAPCTSPCPRGMWRAAMRRSDSPPGSI